jgi:hypothetical protein
VHGLRRITWGPHDPASAQRTCEVLNLEIARACNICASRLQLIVSCVFKAPDIADFILISGTERLFTSGSSSEGEDISEVLRSGDMRILESTLTVCLHRRLMMVCINPDKVVVTPKGVLTNRDMWTQ